MTSNNRSRFASAVSGDVLEIGPGFQPFGTVPGARVTYVGRPLPGGRDANIPELVGMPEGPAIDLERDLDVDGLKGLDDGSFDTVVACHVVEHLVNPVAGLIELTRVLRPGGRLVVVLPDRTKTFDQAREPTTLDHVLQEYAAGVTVLSEEHIREFVAKVGPPAEVDAELIELHRRRSLHAHCWTGAEFAALVTGLLALGLIDWQLNDLYLCDEDPGGEFGLVLEHPVRRPASPVDAMQRFVERWCELVLGDPDRDPAALAAFSAALERDVRRLDVPAAARLLTFRPAELMVERTSAIWAEVQRLRRELERQNERLAMAEARRDALERSRAYRAGRILATPVRLLRSEGSATGGSPTDDAPIDLDAPVPVAGH
jgi:SAM-dependent methyltransferase